MDYREKGQVEALRKDPAEGQSKMKLRVLKISNS
jgi:hypothetical protein